MKHPRIAIAALSLSAAGFVGLISHEGFTDRAIIPVKGDRPTVGFGSTFRDDGTPVQMGDTITAPRAVQRSFNHISKDESRLKQCVSAPLHQHEYDTLVDHAYQYGAAATCRSTVVRLTNQGKYAEACQAYLSWKFVAGRDCSVRSNGCYGVWLRSQERAKKCMGEG
jgi:GH24 family phage-related lysozyme (muramidase)